MSDDTIEYNEMNENGLLTFYICPYCGFKFIGETRKEMWRNCQKKCMTALKAKQKLRTLPMNVAKDQYLHKDIIRDSIQAMSYKIEHHDDCFVNEKKIFTPGEFRGIIIGLNRSLRHFKLLLEE